MKSINHPVLEKTEITLLHYKTWFKNVSGDDDGNKNMAYILHLIK